MKSILLLLLGIMTFNYGTQNVGASNSSTNYDEIVLADNTRTITVYLIKQITGDVWSTSAVSGLYNPDYGTYGEITIKGITYTVHLNPAYGQERDGRADYRYYASDYYFNL